MNCFVREKSISQYPRSKIVVVPASSINTDQSRLIDGNIYIPISLNEELEVLIFEVASGEDFCFPNLKKSIAEICISLDKHFESSLIVTAYPADLCVDDIDGVFYTEEVVNEAICSNKKGHYGLGVYEFFCSDFDAEKIVEDFERLNHCYL